MMNVWAWVCVWGGGLMGREGMFVLVGGWGGGLKVVPDKLVPR